MVFKIFKENIQIIPELLLPCASQCLVPHTPKFRSSQSPPSQVHMYKVQDKYQNISKSPPSQVHMYNVQVKYQNISKLRSKLIIKMFLRKKTLQLQTVFLYRKVAVRGHEMWPWEKNRILWKLGPDIWYTFNWSPSQTEYAAYDLGYLLPSLHQCRPNTIEGGRWTNTYSSSGLQKTSKVIQWCCLLTKSTSNLREPLWNCCRC